MGGGGKEERRRPETSRDASAPAPSASDVGIFDEREWNALEDVAGMSDGGGAKSKNDDDASASRPPSRAPERPRPPVEEPPRTPAERDGGRRGDDASEPGVERDRERSSAAIATRTREEDSRGGDGDYRLGDGGEAASGPPEGATTMNAFDEVRSIHWFPYDPVGVVNAVP